MDLWDTYLDRPGLMYGQGQLYLSTGPRQHASIAQLADRAAVLELNRAMYLPYSESHRYIVAKEISYDMVASVYDVNTRSVLAVRLGKDLDTAGASKLRKVLQRLKGGNLELRVIGQQTGHATCNMGIDMIHEWSGAKLMEVDLFGNELRNIAIDTSTGVTYNLLLLNRIYRPGELACQTRAEDFWKTVSELVLA